MASPDEETPWARLWRWRMHALTLLLVLLTLTQIWTLYTLARLRNVAHAQLDDLTAQIERAEGESIAASIALERPLPVRAEVPIRQRLTVPIRATVPISQDLRVPLSTPLGSVELPIPLRLSVPISLSVPVEIDQSVAISTTVDLSGRTPIRIPIRETSLADYLRRLRERLAALSGEF